MFSGSIHFPWEDDRATRKRATFSSLAVLPTSSASFFPKRIASATESSDTERKDLALIGVFVLFPRLCYNYVEVQNKKRVELTLHAAGLCSLALHHLEYLSFLGPPADEFIPLIRQINASLGSSHSVQ